MDGRSYLTEVAAAIAVTSPGGSEALSRCVKVAVDAALAAGDFVDLVEEVERLSGWRLTPPLPTLY